VIVLDTSMLVEGLEAGGSMRRALRDALVARQRILLPTLVLYEWLRGPRVQAELDAQEALFPAAEALPFDVAEARIAAELYRGLPRPRGREVDLAIAACALSHDAMLWTLNPNDFRDVPGLRFWE
jgi:predicted nucleic acid-binding protein